MTSPQLTELNAAGRMLGKQLKISNASSDNELAAAFAAFAQAGVHALVVAADPFFDDRRSGIVALAARYSIPASYTRREFVIDGGLASYGTDNADSIRHAGIYVGRILKGERPYDLPVQQPTKYQLVINL